MASKYVKYGEDGVVLKRHHFHNRKRHGKQEEYFPNGNLKILLNYSHGKKNGNQCEFFEDGKRKSSIYYRKGKIHGKGYSYFPSGHVESISSFFNGKQHGISMLLYENGFVKEETLYKNGKKHGFFRCFHPCGSFMGSRRYIMDRKSGVYREYHPNGQLKIKVRYHSNGQKKNGRYKVYDSKGQVIQVFCLHRDKLCGLSTTYYSDGCMKNIRHYVNGKKHGLFRKFDRNGSVEVEGNYNDNFMDGPFYYYKSNKIEKYQYFSMGVRDGVRVEFDDNQRILNFFRFKKGLLEGEQFENNKKKFYLRNLPVLEKLEEKQECSVCWEECSWKTKCNHGLCQSCISKMNNLLCPMCRGNMIHEKK